MKKPAGKPDPIVWAWRDALDALSVRNTPMEIVPLSVQGEPMPQARLRLLAMTEDGGLIVERPDDAGPAQEINARVEVAIYVVSGAQRMKARSRVVSVGPFALNEQMTVPAATLAPPTGVQSAQRRECYRLPTGHMDLHPVRLSPLVPVPNFDGWDARMLDLSDRGIGLSLPVKTERAMALVGRTVNLDLQLVEKGPPLKVKARVVRVFGNDKGKACVGMAFEHESMVEQRRTQNAIQAFSTEQQRRELRRTRGTG